MTPKLRRLAFALVTALGVAFGTGVVPHVAGALAAATPVPLGSSPPTPPPITATATPSPSGQLIRYSGQILDAGKEFVFFTTGDGFRLSPGAKIVDPGGGPTTLHPETRVYARAAFDTGNGQIVELALSKTPLPFEASYAAIKGFAVVVSTPAPNPDLRGGEGLTGRDVLVLFTVQVPPKTPFADSVYLATDVSGWSATAIRMDRIDALHYRIAQTYKSGTRFLYRYTRGSWQSAERGQDGLQVPPRQLVVRNSDTQNIDNVVYSWGDEQPNAPDLGGAVPTPYNPMPIQTPPHH